MKQTLSFFVAVLFNYSILFAQADLNTGYATQMNHVFGLIDKSRIPSGILLDHAMEFADLKEYNGQLSDSNKVSVGVLRDIYTTVMLGAVHNNAGNFYHPDYIDSLWGTQRQPEIITLSGVLYNYHLLRDDAVSSNLITLNNGRFSDRFVNGVWQNPYQQQTVFAVSPPIQSYTGRSFQVKLPGTLWLSNIGTISSVAVDFNDGAGYNTVPFDQTVNVSYSDTGMKIWSFRVTLPDATQLYSHTEIKITPEPNRPDYIGGSSMMRFSPNNWTPQPMVADEAWNGQTAEGWITVDFANAPINGVHRLVRPLIVVEGFDPGHVLAPELPAGITNFNSFVGQLDNPLGTSQLTGLLRGANQLYDIIYVDWQRGTDFLQRNALLLERVIRWVNEQKVIDGTTEPNVILGQSMGGVIARWALRDMENRNLPHDTRLFISWDAPQQGAHVPVSMQHMARHANSLYLSTNIPTIIGGYNNVIRPFVNLSVRGFNELRAMFNLNAWDEIGALPSNSLILAGLNLMDVPAARQMLLYRVNLTGGIDNALHDEWQTELQTLGYPQLSRNIAVSNGSECGMNQGFQPGSNLFTYSGSGNTRVLGDLFGSVASPFASWALGRPQLLLGLLTGRNNFIFDFYCKAQPTSGTGQIYKGSITYSKTILWLVNVNTTITNWNRNAVATVLPIDGSPGGFYELPVTLEDDDFSNWIIKYNIAATNVREFNFVPTTSALDIGSGATALTVTDYNDRYIGAAPPIAPLNSPFDNFTTGFNRDPGIGGQVNNNEVHIDILARNGDFVAEELNGNTNVATTCEVFCDNNTVAGAEILCTTEIYTAPFAPGVQYNWILDNPFLVTTQITGNTIQITRNAGAQGELNISVQTVGACGVNTLTKTILLGFPQTESIEFANGYGTDGHFCSSHPNNTFTIYPASGQFNYEARLLQWPNLTVVHTQSAHSGENTLSYIPLPGWYVLDVRPLSVCGAGEWFGYEVESIDCSILGKRSGQSFNLTVSPNPVKNDLNVSISNEIAEIEKLGKEAGVTFELYHFNSRSLIKTWSFKSRKPKQQLNIRGINKGQYILKARVGAYQESTQIIIE